MAIVTSVDDTDAKAIAGSLTIPMGHAFGLQIDGAVADLDLNFTDDVALYGVGVHAFWRDPSRALVGVYGHAVQLDVLGGVNIYTAGVESEFYLDRFTVESIIGFTDADFVEPAFHSRTQLAYYPTDNLKLSVGHTHNHNLHSFQLGGEWGLSSGSSTTASLFADTTITENGETNAWAGMRFYFGQSDKSLIRRHREDDPATDGAYLLGSHIFWAEGMLLEMFLIKQQELNVWRRNCIPLSLATCYQLRQSVN